MLFSQFVDSFDKAASLNDEITGLLNGSRFAENSIVDPLLPTVATDAGPGAPDAPADILTDGSIKKKIFRNIEHGKLAAEDVNAIVLHRTGAANAESTLAAYESQSVGAHFLIDDDGTIYQTANMDKVAWHVGNIRSRGEEEKSWTPDEHKEIDALKVADRGKFGRYVKDLHAFEVAKGYPGRYPHNNDSIGIEVVGEYDSKNKNFTAPTDAQLKSVARLVDSLKLKFNLTNNDIYRHGEISYKDAKRTEGKGLGY